MKQISMTELKENDIFTFEVRIHGRKSYQVLKTPEPQSTQISVLERKENAKPEMKRIKGYVTYLRTLNQ